MWLWGCAESRITCGLFTGLIVWSTIATEAAEPTPKAKHKSHHREKVYAARIVNVPLQPFSFERPSSRVVPAVQVAYYSSHRERSAEPAKRDEDDSGTVSRLAGRSSHPMVHGNRAILRNGIAYAPSNAPDRVKAAIWAVNTIRRKPYTWGGGHESFHDGGYDCSGTVSFALHYAGVLDRPLASSELLRYGERGRGRWITIYSRRGHTFAVIAGLRLDTTDFRYGGDVGPRWHLDGRSTWGFEARHPAGL
jgi:hypothetical protein